MEEIKKYGDLNDSELLEFLAEIKSGDEDIEEAEENASDKIVEEEAQSALSELPENAEIEAYYGNDAWRNPAVYTKGNKRITVLYGPYGSQKAAEGLVKALKKKAERLKKDRTRIQREAFNQNYIKLSDEIGEQNIKLLISLLVKEHTRMIDKYSSYINRRLAVLLSPLIPRRLRLCRMLYPDSIRMSPGFMYKASEEYGGGLSFWATPLIPYYFRQNTEQKILLEHKSNFLYSIDKAVSFYHYHSVARQKKEIRYASGISWKKTFSYFDLLKHNPFWFETLYNELKTNINKSE